MGESGGGEGCLFYSLPKRGRRINRTLSGLFVLRRETLISETTTQSAVMDAALGRRDGEKHQEEMVMSPASGANWTEII